jgi:hypothetical protein
MKNKKSLSSTKDWDEETSPKPLGMGATGFILFIDKN